ERRVVVKLSDFGLSTRDIESSDMDCGSAPYMSYGEFSLGYHLSVFLIPIVECRNNVAPTYKPRAADIWSLGIVLINMCVHNVFYVSYLMFLNHFGLGCTTSTHGRIPLKTLAPPFISSAKTPSRFLSIVSQG